MSASGTEGKSGPGLTVLSFHGHSPRQLQLFGAYTAFIAALLILTLSLNWPKAWVAVTLFAISLPALLVLLFLDQVVRVEGQIQKSILRGAAFLLGTVPSLSGAVIVIGHVSLVAAVLFILSVVFWVFVLGVAVRLKKGENTDGSR